MVQSLTGIILAGGDHSRMKGTNRALLPIAGELLIQRQIREMSSVCDEIIVVTNDPKPFLNVLDCSVRIITDYMRGKGMLGGMHAGITLATHDTVWVVGCDMPLISASAASFMQRWKDDFRFEAVVPKIGGRLVMLHGIYAKSAAKALEQLLNTGDWRPEQLLHFLRWSELGEQELKMVGVPVHFHAAIKTEDDYRLWLTRLEQSPTV